jgi:hypothetical protein
MAWLVGLVCRISDWLFLYRAIDEPALQDALAWDDYLSLTLQLQGIVV